ncbi:hypothetical protein H5410_036556 [Solanum commersonii]|uniref:Uncharacterized protein n=1 Tax=Solanum commersonii TaxID=4109 RepID=A0A9J5Y7S9_SOLCO|nr:hypothetical protein H5410_036556 [Solanum commersonii]
MRIPINMDHINVNITRLTLVNIWGLNAQIRILKVPLDLGDDFSPESGIVLIDPFFKEIVVGVVVSGKLLVGYNVVGTTPCFYTCVGSEPEPMGDEVEKAKQEARNVNSLMECTDMLDKVNLKITEQTFEYVQEQSKILKLLDKVDAIPLEITVQAELEEIEARQGESYGETEIVSQFWI